MALSSSPSSTSKKILVLGLVAGAGALVYGAVKLKKLSNFGDQVQVDNDIKVISKSFAIFPPSISMTLSITPTVSNPTNGAVKISQPYVQLTLAPNSTTIVGKSTPSSKMFTIPPMGVQIFDPIIIPITIGLENLSAVWSRFRAEKVVGIYVATKVFIGIFGGKVSKTKNDVKEQKF